MTPRRLLREPNTPQSLPPAGALLGRRRSARGLAGTVPATAFYRRSNEGCHQQRIPVLSKAGTTGVTGSPVTGRLPGEGGSLSAPESPPRGRGRRVGTCVRSARLCAQGLTRGAQLAWRTALGRWQDNTPQEETESREGKSPAGGQPAEAGSQLRLARTPRSPLGRLALGGSCSTFLKRG